MSLSSKGEYLTRIHPRYQRAGREGKSRILDEFCAVCGYHRKAALRLLNRPLEPTPGRKKPGPEPTYDPQEIGPILKEIWLQSEQLCSKLLKAALPEWLSFYEERHGALDAELRAKVLAISPAQIDRLLRPMRVGVSAKGRASTKPGSLLRHHVPTRGGPADTSMPGAIEVDTVAHGGDTTAGNFIYSLTFTELYSGWTEIRAVWNKGSQGVLEALKELEGGAPLEMRSFPNDNGSEFLNWTLHEHLTGRRPKVTWTRSRAYRKNDNAHCEQKNWTHVRQLVGYERLGHAELVAPLNKLYSGAWSHFNNHFRPSFKLERREKKGSKTRRVDEKTPQTPYQRLVECAQIDEATKERLHAEHKGLNPFDLKKEVERDLKAFFTALGNHELEST